MMMSPTLWVLQRLWNQRPESPTQDNSTAQENADDVGRHLDHGGDSVAQKLEPRQPITPRHLPSEQAGQTGIVSGEQDQRAA